MLPNAISVSSTLPRVKNKTYDQNVESVSCSKSVDFQKDCKSWPLEQVPECNGHESLSPLSSSESENETNILESIPSHNICETVFQANNLQPNYVNEPCLNSQTNILNIILPLVSENDPLHSHSKSIEHDKFLLKENCDVPSYNHVQYSPSYSINKPIYINKNINNRNHSLPEDSELNRFSSTFENIKTLLKEGLVDGLDEMPPDFQPPNPPLLYRVSSLPNLLSHDSTKSHHSCSYLTMCATKHELIMNKLCKNMVAKHDMSVQVSTELFKNQNEKILVNSSCQTDDILINFQENNRVLVKDTSQNICNESNDIFKQEHKMEICKDTEINNINEKDCTNMNSTDILNKEHELITNLKNDCASIDYTNINILNNNDINEAEKDCPSNGYININILNTKYDIKTSDEEECDSLNYSDVHIFNKEHEINVNENHDTNIGYININIFNKDKIRTNIEESNTNVSHTKINTFNKECKMKSVNDDHMIIDYTNINVINNGKEDSINEEHCSKIGYTNINIFDRELEVKQNGEDCVDIGYTNFSLYDKGIDVDPNDDSENYANANILKKFLNEQLSLNNVDEDFDSFLFGPLPPSPIEEIVSELPVMNKVETKRENSAPVPFIFNVHKNEATTSIIKSRSIDAEFSHNFQQHQKIGTRSVQSERRTYPSEIPVSDKFHKPSMLKTSVHPSTIEKLSDISNSLPDTPLLGRCDFPRQYSATGTKTMSQMSNSLSINIRGAGHGSSIGLGQAMAGAELLHLNGPGRGWYPRQRQFRPVSVEQLDKLACKSPVGHSQWDTREGHKPVTLPPNLTPKFFHRSPREALRRVTSLLIRKGNTNKSNKTKTVFSSSVIGPHGDISEENVSCQSKRGFFKSLWRK